MSFINCRLIAVRGLNANIVIADHLIGTENFGNSSELIFSISIMGLHMSLLLTLPEGEEDYTLDGEELENRVVWLENMISGKVEQEQCVQC